MNINMSYLHVNLWPKLFLSMIVLLDDAEVMNWKCQSLRHQ